MSVRLPAAVLWDLDGTLVDSEPYWIVQEQELVASFGGVWSHDDALTLVGRALMDSVAYLVAHSPVNLPPEQVVERLVAGVAAQIRQRVPWQPGAVELLTAVRGAGVPTALVTMSYRPITEALHDALHDAFPRGAFDVVVTGEQVTHGKPHPEPYLTAAARLGLDPADCIAIEDSETGARSAAAAGAQVIVVPSVKPVPRMPGVVQVATLAGITPAELVDLVDLVDRPGFAAVPGRS